MPEALNNYSPWDLAIFGTLAVGSLVYGFVIGRGRIAPVLISTYMAFVLVEFAPFLNAEEFLVRIGVFGILFFIIMFVLLPVIFQSPVGSETFGVFGTLVLALAQTGFFIAVVLSFLPPEITKGFSEFTTVLFAAKNSLFYWAAAPVATLLILGRIANR